MGIVSVAASRAGILLRMDERMWRTLRGSGRPILVWLSAIAWAGLIFPLPLHRARIPIAAQLGDVGKVPPARPCRISPLGVGEWRTTKPPCALLLFHVAGAAL